MINLLIITTAWWVSDWDVKQTDTDTDKEVPTPGGEKTNNMGRQRWDLLLETGGKHKAWSSLGSNSGPTPTVLIWHSVYGCFYVCVHIHQFLKWDLLLTGLHWIQWIVKFFVKSGNDSTPNDQFSSFNSALYLFYTCIYIYYNINLHGCVRVYVCTYK